MSTEFDESVILKCADIAAHCTCLHVRKASRAITNLYDEALAPAGLTTNQMGLLIAITLMRNPSINTLSEKVMMDRTTLSRNLKPLELQSLIRVEAGEDKRIRLVKITKKGQASLMEAIPLWEEVQNRIIGRLGQNNWKDLLKKLNATAALSTLG